MIKMLNPFKYILATLIILSSLICEGQEKPFPYKSSKRDIAFLSGGILLEVSNNVLGNKKDHNLSLIEIERLDRTTINGFDRTATYNWNESWLKFSGVPFKTMPLLPLALAVPQIKNKNWGNTLTLGVMYAEAFLFTKSITGITKSIAGRIRPYLYNTSLTAEERFNLQSNKAPIANTSFFSGHSSTVFASAVFLSKTFTDIYGKTAWSKVIWGTTLTLASVTAYARVKAGVHFPTDVIVGAVVGSSIGYLIPTIHKVNPEKMQFSFLPGYFSLTYKL